MLECTRDRVPLDWAMTQNNLGNALRTLGERESGPHGCKRRSTASRGLAERTHERLPLERAMTQNNLGNALSTLGRRESGTERLREAVEAYHAALDVFKPAKVTHYTEMTQRNLARAETLLVERRAS